MQVLAEKGGPVVEEVIAHPKFRILATMNPGGDFGKRELSPALRNRFTEIWVPSINDVDDLQYIVADRLVLIQRTVLAFDIFQIIVIEWKELMWSPKASSYQSVLSWIETLISEICDFCHFCRFARPELLCLKNPLLEFWQVRTGITVPFCGFFSLFGKGMCKFGNVENLKLGRLETLRFWNGRIPNASKFEIVNFGHFVPI